MNKLVKAMTVAAMLALAMLASGASVSADDGGAPLNITSESAPDGDAALGITWE